MRTRTARGPAASTVTRAAASSSVTHRNSTPSRVRSHPSARIKPRLRDSMIPPRSPVIGRSALHGAEREPPYQEALEHDRHDDVGQHDHDRGGAHLPVEGTNI